MGRINYRNFLIMESLKDDIINGQNYFEPYRTEPHDVAGCAMDATASTFDAALVVGENQSQAARTPLLKLPADCILMVFGQCTTPGDVSRLGRTCSYLYHLSKPAAYKKFVGPQPWHYSVVEGDYWDLAKKQVELRTEMRNPQSKSPEKLADELAELLYVEPDQHLMEWATRILLILQQSSERDTPMWKEVVAACLVIQRRGDSAKKYYEHLTDTTSQLQNSIRLLTAARFGWECDQELSIDVPEHYSKSEHYLKYACILAAGSSNLRVLEKLHNSDIALNQCVDDTILGYAHDEALTPAFAAAARGDEDVLRFLHGCGVDLLAQHEWVDEDENTLLTETALKKAAASGKIHAVAYLLSVGASADALDDGEYMRSPAALALRREEFDIFRLFMRHTTSLKGNCRPGGGLWVTEVFVEETKTTSNINILKFLVNDVRVDIDAVGPTGQRAVHMAAKYGDVEMMKTLVELGANVSALDATGQSALELAVSFGHFALSSWLAVYLGESERENYMVTNKLALVKYILRFERNARVRSLVMSGRLLCPNSLTLEQYIEKVETAWEYYNMDRQLALIWVRHCSIADLTLYKANVLGTELEAAMHILSFVLFVFHRDCRSSVALSGPNTLIVERARQLLEAVYPLSDFAYADVTSLAEHVASEMRPNDIDVLTNYYCNSLSGRHMAAAHKEKFLAFDSELTNFCSRCHFIPPAR